MATITSSDSGTGLEATVSLTSAQRRTEGAWGLEIAPKLQAQDRGRRAFHRLPYYWKTGQVMSRLVEAIASELELDFTLQAIRNAHTIHFSYGRSLDYVASNAGIKRLPGEEGWFGDFWLRERVKLWIFIQVSRGTIAEIKRAVGWYIGIRHRNRNWEADYLPKILVNIGRSPHWPYQEVDGVGRGLTNFLEVELPIALLDLWEPEAVETTGMDTTGAIVWEDVPYIEEDFILGPAHHLMQEVLELVELMVPAGWKGRLFLQGETTGSDTTGSVTWENAFELRVAGPVEIGHTPSATSASTAANYPEDYVVDYVDDPSGNFWTYETEHFGSWLQRGLLWPLLFGPLVGKRFFRYGLGGELWP